MKLNAEQIKKALECCVNLACLECPYHRMPTLKDCIDFNMGNVLSLINSQEQRTKELQSCVEYLSSADELVTAKDNRIKELTEENERLREDNEIKSQQRANIFEIVNAFDRGRTDGVCKIREQFKERYEIWEEQDVTEYNYATSLLDKIAKEMLEEKNVDKSKNIK